MSLEKITQNFIVASNVWSVSYFATNAFNLNKDVLCFHSARVEIANDENLQSNENLKDNINQLQKGCVNRQNRSLDDLYDEIYLKMESKAYGSFDFLRMRYLPVVFRKYKSTIRNFNIANVVRHPVNLVWSGFGQFKDLFRYEINELYWISEKVVDKALLFCNQIGAKYNLNLGDFENLAFFGAFDVLGSLMKNLNAYRKVKKQENLNFSGTFQMEILTSKVYCFKGFYDKLGILNLVSDDYLEDVFKTGFVNKHKQDSNKLSSEERFNSFLPWQKGVFVHFLDLHQLEMDYKLLDYNFDFIRNEK